MKSGDPMLQSRVPVDSRPPDCVDVVLDHLARYRLTVFPALQRLPTLSDRRPREIKALLADCQRQSLIGSAPLYPGAKYWYLDALGAQCCELPDERAGPLSEPARLRAIALLRFCCLCDSPRRLLKRDELIRGFPMLARPGLPHGYYFDPAGPGRLGLARTDAALRGRWDRVLENLRDDIHDHVHRPGFQQIVQAGRFEITLLTVFRQKARRICESLPQVCGTGRVPVRVLAMPELLPLIDPSR